MEPLVQSMSMKHKTSGDDNNIAYTESAIFVMKNSRTVSNDSFPCDVCVHPLVYHTKKEYGTYQYVQN